MTKSNNSVVANIPDHLNKNSEKSFNLCSTLKNYISEFCENTSIHGLKFLCERNRSIFERIWWLIVLTLSLVSCVFCILEVYSKWTTAPVIVSFATTQTSIRDIPFPAVTICPDVKSVRNKYNYTDTYFKNANEINITEAKKFAYLNLICDRVQHLDDNATKFTDEEVLEFITDVSCPLRDVISSVSWKGTRYYNAEQFFTPIINTEGVCYTFNILDKKDLFTDVTYQYKNFYSNSNTSSWNIEDGFKEYFSKRYPRNTLVSGTDGGIDIVFKINDENIDYNCNPNFVGFKVTLLHPALVPRGKKQFITVPLNQSILAAVKPIMMKTSKNLIDANADIRQCFFSHEKKLLFFKQYNQPNCLFECLTNFTLSKCGCVGFDMPKLRGTPICGSGNNHCVTSARALYLSEYVQSDNVNNPPETYAKHCKCLPTCTSLDFEVEISQSDWYWEKFSAYTGNKPSSMSRIKIFFKDMQFITSARNQLYSTTDFIANCGGLLGLFVGFSTISLFEIIYFITMRLFCNMITRKRRQLDKNM